MMHHSKVLRLLAATVVLGATLPLSFSASAQDWPAKPVRFIVPFPPGGTTDPLARLLGVKLSDTLKQQFFVENRPGAGGSIGTAVAAKAAPDGYTFLVVFDSHGVNQSLLSNLPYDTAKDFAPVMLVGTAPYAIATQAAKPWKSFAEVVAASKAKPDSISIGSIGNGTLGHLVLVQAQQMAGFKITHVPFAGGGPMTQNILGGQIDMGAGSVALLLPQVRSGKLRAIATTGEKRASSLPDVPTLIEQGFPGLTAHAWWGIYAPAATPKPIIDKFHAELVKVLGQPDVRKTLSESLAMDLVVSTPEELQKWTLEQLARWGKVVRENGIKAD
jgi:tripartite-type tricarboxylate transporter receptor subunit TctC